MFIAPPDKYFYTVDHKILTNLHQLSEYIGSCSAESYTFHANAHKNDFCTWIEHVFGAAALALSIKDLDAHSASIKIEEFINAPTDNPVTKADEKLAQKAENTSDNANSDHVSEMPEDVSANIEHVAENSAPSSSIPTENAGKFHEFSDEELERFTKFNSKSEEATNSTDQADFLKTELNELNNVIKDLRKSGKDMIIAELLMRVVEPKIAFYQQTQKAEDYSRLTTIFNEIRKEIEYASTQTESNLADEIIKGLELQSVMLKKDFVPKKTGALGKIFKQTEQET